LDPQEKVSWDLVFGEEDGSVEQGEISNAKRQGSMPVLRQVDGAAADIQPGDMEQWLVGWWVGGGRVIGSICPFCLDEDWDGVERVHRGVLFKTLALAISVFITYASIFLFVVIVSLIEEGLENWLFIEKNKDYISVFCVFVSIFFGYRSYKWLVNTTRLPF
ncbi:hypothetical protein, partial [Azotobacter beijerinckii]|uniref:hypothetical protein n=1 Tax=Azotobacter beijerinckii TaxID=170623 RepID=UPI0015880915